MPDLQPATAPAGAALNQTERWKKRLAEQRAALRDRYFESGSATELLRRHCRLVDQQLQAVWRHLEMPAEIALVAVGGYGRGQLFPYSDIDLLILLPANASESAGAQLEQFVGRSEEHTSELQSH